MTIIVSAATSIASAIERAKSALMSDSFTKDLNHIGDSDMPSTIGSAEDVAPSVSIDTPRTLVLTRVDSCGIHLSKRHGDLRSTHGYSLASVAEHHVEHQAMFQWLCFGQRQCEAAAVRHVC